MERVWKGCFQSIRMEKARCEALLQAVTVFNHPCLSWNQNTFSFFQHFTVPLKDTQTGVLVPKKSWPYCCWLWFYQDLAMKTSLAEFEGPCCLPEHKPDLMFLSIVTDLCICTEYVNHTKCFISLPKSQDVDWNHLLFPSVHFYLCWFFSGTETLASRHRAASSVSSHFSSAVSPEWSLLICNDLNSTAGFLFSLLSHSKERLNHFDRDLELSRHPYSSGIQNPDIREQ